MAADLASTTVAGATFAMLGERPASRWPWPPWGDDDLHLTGAAGTGLRFGCGRVSPLRRRLAIPIRQLLRRPDVGCLWFSRARPVCRCCTAAFGGELYLRLAGPQ